MRYWYYHEAGQQKGPIAEEAFVKLFESGVLSADTLVWTESLKDWQQARTVEGLVPPALSLPPPPLGNTMRSPPVHAFVPSGPQIRPWPRFWARTTDYLLFGGLTGIILAFTFPAPSKIQDVLLGMIAAFVFVFVEPWMLSTWGTTPGKALFNVRLRKNDGTKPNYAEALSRAFNVWVRGEGLGIPIVLLFMRTKAYNKLTKEGITSWDREGGFTVAHKNIGAGRIIAAVALFIGFFILSR
ncbi:RDD family protein [Synechococcus sp. BA-124 BA4]|uniref:RDD family protein n=1 Tax=unclassified Synechococcus TaxID=2626047 RepID=UPI002AD4D82B|nr:MULTISPECIES: RDD family protein [unclassified Synechococcus]MEA5401123.1 RDD family protein [Synechococcus sp. BA-124 BA4]CAK6688863.1 hypothetical protein BBFGKLBO_00501 [Synechococcus sp. CBW1107]